MPSFAAAPNPFGPGLLKFLGDLEKSNTKAWFEANRQRYEDQVREPALAFVRAIAPGVRKVSAHLVASDKKVGGSLMRVHRDVRFSQDKQPFKTNVGIAFRHAKGKDIHAPLLYVHVAPGECFLGAGMWHPDAKALGAVRAAIVADGKAWTKVRDGKALRAAWEFEGDALKTTPRGYPADHPLIDDLRRKDHIAVHRIQRKDVTRKDLVAYVAKRFLEARDLLAWQCKALGLPF